MQGTECQQSDGIGDGVMYRWLCDVTVCSCWVVD